LELAEPLGDGRPLGVEGLAMASLSIIDAPSPLYHGDAARSLAWAVRVALPALERGQRTAGTAERQPRRLTG
jgi:hypothetical protein